MQIYNVFMGGGQVKLTCRSIMCVHGGRSGKSNMLIYNVYVWGEAR